ncbi:MAG TPA: AsmA family protein [Immundisolibacter sp.]
MVRWMKVMAAFVLALMAMLVACVVVLEWLGWNVLRGPVSRAVTASTGRAFSIHGDLDVDLGLTPRISATKVQLANPPWADPDHPMLRARRVEIDLHLPDLLRGRVVLPRVLLDHPETALVRRADGSTSWDFGGDDESATMTPPRIRALIVRDGRLRLDDAVRGIELRAGVASTNRLDAPLAEQLRVDADGRYNGQPFRLVANGGSLFNLAQGNDRYPVALDVRAGATHIALDGAVGTAAKDQKLDARLRISGADMADLYGLLGVVLPNSPPYALKARLRREREAIRVDDLTGNVGDSDLAGDMRFETGGERVHMTADLHSRRLDFDDLGALVGAPPSTAEGETASETQKAQARALASDQRLLPDAPLQAERLRAMDADVRYRAASVNARAVPFKDVSLDVHLKDGVLRLGPASLSFPQGSAELALTLDGTQTPPATDLDLRLKNIRMDDLTPRLDGQAALSGTLDGRVQMTGRGNSVRAFAAHSNGRVGLAMDGGRMSHLVVELVGVDVAEALGVLIGKDQAVAIRCAAGALDLRDGQLHTRSLLVDTTDSLITASGTVDLATERMDMQVSTASKGASVFSAQTPVTLRGPLRKPGVGIEAQELAARGLAAAALGALLTPLGAMLAFVDPGLAEDSDCAAQLRQAGAAQSAPPPSAPAQQPAP